MGLCLIPLTLMGQTPKEVLAELEKQEVNLAKTLSDKYGKGSIDLESGTFTPIN